MNNERVKEIEKLKSENRGVREDVSECKISVEKLLQRMPMSQILMNDKKTFEELNKPPQEGKY